MSTEPEDPPVRHRNRWIWVSAVLAVIAIGSLIWALTIRSDLDATQKELDTAQAELESAEQQLDDSQQELTSAKQDLDELQAQAGEDEVDLAGVVVAGGALYRQFAEQLGATEEELAAAQEELEAAQRAAAEADEEAAAAEQAAADAGSETERAEAEAEQARAQAEAAEAHATLAVDCAKAVIGAFGGLFEGGDAEEQAAAVREQLEGIVADCEAELAL
jgi:chromosome segregation ATPase